MNYIHEHGAEAIDDLVFGSLDIALCELITVDEIQHQNEGISAIIQ